MGRLRRQGDRREGDGSDARKSVLASCPDGGRGVASNLGRSLHRLATGLRPQKAAAELRDLETLIRLRVNRRSPRVRHDSTPNYRREVGTASPLQVAVVVADRRAACLRDEMILWTLRALLRL